MIKICGLLITLIFVFGCNDTSDKSDTEKSRLAAARLKWEMESSSFFSYSFNSHAYCFCSFRETVRISVVDTAITSVKDIQTGNLVSINDTSLFKTVDQWFTWIESSLKRNPEAVNIKYNELYGYPEEFNFDYDLDVMDEQFGLEIDSLKFELRE